MHRLICNTPIGAYTDHINGNGLDNRKENLRVCTAQENARNRLGKKNVKSKYKGVIWRDKAKKWEAKAVINKKYHYLGHFEREEDAARAYSDFAKSNFGEFFCDKTRRE